VKPRFLRFLDLERRVLIDKNIGGGIPMSSSTPEHPLPLFLSQSADEPSEHDVGQVWDRTAISSRILKATIAVLSAATISMAIVLLTNPATLLADVMALLVDRPVLETVTVQPTPVQSIADAEPLPPTAKDAPAPAETITASEPPGQSQTEESQPASEALFQQFQAWLAQENERAQIGPIQPVQQTSAQVVQDAPAPVRPTQRHRRVRPVQNARAELRNAQKPRAKVRQEQTARAQIGRAQDARAQEGSAQATSSWPHSFFGWRN
jgi:hypothetical protein